MSVFYTPLFYRAAWYSRNHELLCRSVEFIFLRNRNLVRWQLIFSAIMTNKLRGVRAEEYANCVNKFREKVSLETLIWRQIVTSQIPHTKYKWPPHATEWNHPWKFSAYATGNNKLFMLSSALATMAAVFFSVFKVWEMRFSKMYCLLR